MCLQTDAQTHGSLAPVPPEGNPAAPNSGRGRIIKDGRAEIPGSENITEHDGSGQRRAA